MGEYFWSLAIESGSVAAAVWTIKENTAHVVSVSDPVEWTGDADLVNATDQALSSAASKLPEDAEEPSKTVFGVPPSWVADGAITRDHLDHIRIVCGKLSLTPAGFVVLPEAVAHFKKTQDSVPLSAIIVGVGKDLVDVTVFRLGNLVGTVNVGRSASIVDDVIEGLTRFGSSDVLPSAFLIYDGKGSELTDLKQELIAADWGEVGKTVKFLHTPQVEAIDPKEKMVAVSLAGASEIAKVEKVHYDAQKPHHAEHAATPLPQEAHEVLTNEASQDKEEILGGAADVGFITDGSINNLKSPTMPKLPRVPFKNPLSFLKGLGGMGGEKKPAFMIIGAGVVLLLLFLAWWFVPRADVTIYVSPKKIEQKSVKVTLDTKAASADLSKYILPAKTVKVSVSGDRTRSTTGTKTVGDRAKGTVTIYRAGDALTLPAGTTITGPSGLKFSLDNVTQVASGSAAIQGTTKASVTANDIGADYNVASGTLFTVGSYSSSDVQAKSDSAFSGGASREIVAVSKDDLSILEKDLTNDLLERGKTQLTEKTDESEMLIPEAAVATASSRTFSQKVGDEATNVKLTMKADVSSISVAKQQLYDLARELIKSQVPDGYTLSDDQININFSTKPTVSGSTTKFDIDFIVNLLPQVKTDVISQKIAGRNMTFAQNYLSTIGGFQKAEIQLHPSLPGPLKTLPHIAKKISVEVSSTP